MSVSSTMRGALGGVLCYYLDLLSGTIAEEKNVFNDNNSLGRAFSAAVIKFLVVGLTMIDGLYEFDCLATLLNEQLLLKKSV